MSESRAVPRSGGPARSVSFHNYDRTVIAYHGTTRETASQLVDGQPFERSNSDDDWLGTGTYFWEHAPKQAWWWASGFKHKTDPAVVGAVLRLGNCFDLCDPENVTLLRAFYDDMVEELREDGQPTPRNFRQHRKLDCAVFNYVYQEAESKRRPIDSARAVFVPTSARKRVWPGSWIYEETHVQICVRNPKNIFAVWHVRKDGRYGIDPRGI